jgi:sulfur carrier protein
MITIQLNGEEKKLMPGTTITMLLEQLNLKREGIAVAINQRVVPKSDHPDFDIPDAAKIEVIRAVGGG